MADREIATAADYADAMLTARRAKNIIVLLLLLLLLGQLAVFFVVKYTTVIPQPSQATTQPDRTSDMLHYLASGGLFLGVTLSIVLGFVLLLIVNIMLVGRLIGVGRLTSAYILSLLLLVFMFPWQAFLNDVGLTPDRAAFKLPGVLYTWTELTHSTEGARFSNDDVWKAGLKWTRFVAYPLVGVVLLLAIQAKSNRGMRQALGEDETAAPSEPAM